MVITAPFNLTRAQLVSYCFKMNDFLAITDHIDEKCGIYISRMNFEGIKDSLLTIGFSIVETLSFTIITPCQYSPVPLRSALTVRSGGKCIVNDWTQ
jgi:hypothetical protein